VRVDAGDFARVNDGRDHDPLEDRVVGDQRLELEVFAAMSKNGVTPQIV
jgi:hypothetical protein